MEEKVISITLWGNGTKKGKWLDWYYENKNLMKDLGYKLTHIGIQSQSFTSGKILTVARKEKEILSKISDGEIPFSFACYSLLKNYKTASFDYEILSVRKEEYISIIIKEVDYDRLNIQDVISMMKKYIDYEYGEIYITSRAEMPLLYAATRNADNIKSYSLLKKI